MKKKSCRCGEKKSKVSKYPMGTQNISAASNTFVDSPDYTDLTDKLNRKANKDTAVRSAVTMAGDAAIPGLGTAIGLVDSFTDRTKDEYGIYKSKGAEVLDRISPIHKTKALFSGDKDEMLDAFTFGAAGKSSSDKAKEMKSEAETKAAIKSKNRKFAGTDRTEYQSSQQFKRGTRKVMIRKKYPDGVNTITEKNKKVALTKATEDDIKNSEKYVINDELRRSDSVRTAALNKSEEHARNNTKNYVTELRDTKPDKGKKTGNNTCLTGVCSTYKEAGANAGSFKNYDVKKARSKDIKGDNSIDTRYNNEFIRKSSENGFVEVPIKSARRGDLATVYSKQDGKNRYDHTVIVRGLKKDENGDYDARTYEDHGNNDDFGIEKANRKLYKDNTKILRYIGFSRNKDTIDARTDRHLASLGKYRERPTSPKPSTQLENIEPEQKPLPKVSPKVEPKVKPKAEIKVVPEVETKTKPVVNTPSQKESFKSEPIQRKKESLMERYKKNKGGYARALRENSIAKENDIIVDSKTGLQYKKLGTPKKYMAGLAGLASIGSGLGASGAAASTAASTAGASGASGLGQLKGMDLSFMKDMNVPNSTTTNSASAKDMKKGTGNKMQSAMESPYGQAVLGLTNAFLDSQEDKRKKKRDAGIIPNYPQNFEKGGEVRSGYKKQGMFQNKATGGEGYNVDNTGRALTIGKKLYNNRRSDKDFAKLRVGYTLDGKTELTADQIAAMTDKSKLIRVRVGDGKFGDSNSLYRDNIPQPKMQVKQKAEEKPTATKWKPKELIAYPNAEDYPNAEERANAYQNIYKANDELKKSETYLRGKKAPNEPAEWSEENRSNIMNHRRRGANVGETLEDTIRKRDENNAKRAKMAESKQGSPSTTPTTTAPQMKKGGMVRKSKIKSTLQSMKYGMGKVKC